MSKQRRNRAWYGKQGRDGSIHRSWMKNQGFPDHAFVGRPVVGICNTWSELTPCNSGLRELAEGVKHGAWEAGGVPAVNKEQKNHLRPARTVLGGDVSDARMSGTAYGTVILHVSPEAQASGPLAFVKTGDRIRVSASVGALDLMVSDAELATRRAAWAAGPAHYTRGYAKLYTDHVLQADDGAGLDFLAGKDTRPVTRESH